MKCLDKKRIKLKQGETLALNERIMLSLVSTGQVSGFPRMLIECGDIAIIWLFRIAHSSFA